MGLLPVGLCVIGLLSVYLLGRSLRQLRPNREAILHLATGRRIKAILAVLLLAPVAAAAGLAGLFLLVYRNQFFLRSAHSSIILGLWLVLALAFLLLVLMARLGRRPDLSTLASPLLAVPLVAYLSPLERFQEVFADTWLGLPLIVGVLVAATCLLYVYLARRELVG